ncbi:MULTISPECIES: hypothetical protein [Methylobacterium]|jgi:hypothetical protein|uniref:Secreted protein n=1 Tax=Methylobacterium brachiatum TaxID=269660 RepID=A0AAJ1TSA6_9HYPH|nr:MULTISPECIES: hypothetical protein [Methylobacterium]AYO85520.1 hypothetical protein EBB05_27020 [Methylobacterium brachiatum]EIZ81525.1 hypothetical protein WYO_5824 [Methylobacterium sp. GXF4]KNY22748.1 hypothetical protein AKJ13_10865 [Methylobacterium sp. ARG-1]MCB4801958.1 hypothetical protein [Methylobacterium brachiatum]MDF2598515.1 hypothetical protein [Methylobacterium brachiatum]
MRHTLLAAAALLSLGAAAQAQTTVIERDRPAVVVDRPASESKSVTVHDHGDGCVSKTVRKENEMGDSKTVKKESCD